MKTTHTHRGTCQACGARQAVELPKGIIAKHGYTVAGFGFFNGVCRGSGYLPAEHNTALTIRIMSELGIWAMEKDRLADLVRGRVLMVYSYDTSVWVENGRMTRYGVRGKYEPRTFPLSGATDEMIERAIRDEYEGQEQAARHARAHVDSLRDFVLTRLGKPLYDANQPKPAKPVDGKVDVKNGNIEGAFRTKAAQKLALEKISREYERARRIVVDAVLAVEYSSRTEAQRDLYQVLPFDLHNYRAKHGEQILSMFPKFFETVAEMGRLFALRNEVKARPVVRS
jgi:hypothetical protein